MAKELLKQAQVLVEANKNEFQQLPSAQPTNKMITRKRAEFFGRSNDLRVDILNIRHKVTILGTPEDVAEINKLISSFPKGESQLERWSHEGWTQHILWMWSTLAKNCPSRKLKRQMMQKKPVFMRHASAIEREEFLNIFSTLENL